MVSLLDINARLATMQRGITYLQINIDKIYTYLVLCNVALNQIQIIKNWHDPYYLLDIFITSSHHRMTHILPRICHMLSLPLTSPLSNYINDKPRVESSLGS